MKRDDLRRALELLPPGTSLSLDRDALLEALAGEAAAPTAPLAAVPADDLLSAAEVAARFKVSKRWCYDHQKDLGAVHLSTRAVRFPARKVEQFLARVGRVARAA